MGPPVLDPGYGTWVAHRLSFASSWQLFRNLSAGPSSLGSLHAFPSLTCVTSIHRSLARSRSTRPVPTLGGSRGLRFARPIQSRSPKARCRARFKCCVANTRRKNRQPPRAPSFNCRACHGNQKTPKKQEGREERSPAYTTQYAPRKHDAGSELTKRLRPLESAGHRLESKLDMSSPPCSVDEGESLPSRCMHATYSHISLDVLVASRCMSSVSLARGVRR